MPENKKGQLVYQAQSPDEGALVVTARKFGFVFLNREIFSTVDETQKERDINQVTVEVLGEVVTYDLLAILDFDSFRKRMSVIVKRDGDITLYCKGADSVIFERLDHSKSTFETVTLTHLNNFARSGLRTLCCAMRFLDSTYYRDWARRLDEASLLISNREEKVNALYEEIEQDLILIGSTAIEDKLQDGVPCTIQRLLNAGIKIWVLSGDKKETAVNIGFSCKLISDTTELCVIDSETDEDVKDQLSYTKDKILLHAKGAASSNAKNSAWRGASTSDYFNSTKLSVKEGELVNGFALVVNGLSLVHALEASLQTLFVEVACMCKTVICCRTTPTQKAQVVELIKTYKKCITLAVGDGANDVNMIKTANVGVGISGLEGRQAVLASDYSIAQFCFLERLILVHGRLSYIRMSKFLYYCFYKNFAFSLCNVWYAAFCGYSAQTLYDPMFISLYNVLFTPLPVMALGIFEQDVDHESSVLYPKLYWPGIHNSLFNAKTFMICVLESVLTSLALFFISYGAFKDAIRSNGRDVADLQSVGYVVASYLVVVVTLRCGLETSYWTFFNHFAIWGSIVFYFCMMFVIYSDLFVYEYYGVTTQALGSGLFWFTLGVMLASVTITVFLVKAIISTVHPSLASMIRINKKMALVTTRRPKVRHASKTKSKLQEHHRLHRPHLGYAFSHEEGIGKLITTGSMMKVRQGESGQKGASLGDQSLPTESKLNQMEEVQDKVKKRPEIWSSVPNLPSESVESVQHVYEHEKVQEL